MSKLKKARLLQLDSNEEEASVVIPVEGAVEVVNEDLKPEQQTPAMVQEEVDAVSDPVIEDNKTTTVSLAVDFSEKSSVTLPVDVVVETVPEIKGETVVVSKEALGRVLVSLARGQVVHCSGNAVIPTIGKLFGIAKHYDQAAKWDEIKIFIEGLK